MYGKRFVTGDRQKACLFEQKGSYMASIKDSNGQFKTLQLGTNRPVAFKQFFAAASAAGYDMRPVQGAGSRSGGEAESRAAPEA